jgi:hypothetical protein
MKPITVKYRTEFNGDWLQHQIDLFNNKIVVVDMMYLPIP